MGLAEMDRLVSELRADLRAEREKLTKLRLSYEQECRIYDEACAKLEAAEAARVEAERLAKFEIDNWRSGYERERAGGQRMREALEGARKQIVAARRHVGLGEDGPEVRAIDAALGAEPGDAAPTAGGRAPPTARSPSETPEKP